MSRITKAAAVTIAAGAVLAGSTGVAFADSGAKAAAIGSPGALSGNVLQLPVHIPVNLCGNTLDAVGGLNPAFGNTCVNSSSEKTKVTKHDKKKHHKKHDKKKHDKKKDAKKSTKSW
ncbi:chaplin [Streptomyces sp. NPDC048639]|uniref:chaplin n=1 Tax=Streptomyces sp. NPDC048639 TaxID=3365581 RepID=UPI0037248A10